MLKRHGTHVQLPLRVLHRQCLYEFYTDNSWRQKACSDSKVIRYGGGTGAWVTTRTACHSTATTSRRNQADVDVVGEVDTGGTVYNQEDVACRVNWSRSVLLAPGSSRAKSTTRAGGLIAARRVSRMLSVVSEDGTSSVLGSVTRGLAC